MKGTVSSLPRADETCSCLASAARIFSAVALGVPGGGVPRRIAICAVVPPVGGHKNLPVPGGQGTGGEEGAPEEVVRGIGETRECVAPSRSVPVEEGVPSYLAENQVMQIYGNIFDWLDAKDGEMPYTTPYLGSIGAEQLSYLDYGQETIVKNRGLDHLDELRLIMGFRESGIPWESWERYFTTYPVGKPPEAGSPTGESRLNVNLATEEEIIEFLNRFDQDRIPSELFESNIQEYVINAANIASVLKQQEETTGPLNMMVDAEYRQTGSIQSALDADPTTNYLPRQAEQKFFIRFSQWYQIRLKAEMDDVLASVEAIVQIQRDDEGEPIKDGIVIHHFSLN